jgi:hypothetical protein
VHNVIKTWISIDLACDTLLDNSKWRYHFWPDRKNFVTFRDIFDNIIRNRRVRNISIRKLAVKSMHSCSFATLKLFIVTFWDEMKDDLFSLWQIATFKMAAHLISLSRPQPPGLVMIFFYPSTTLKKPQWRKGASVYSNTHKINSNIHIKYQNMYFKRMFLIKNNDFKH